MSDHDPFIAAIERLVPPLLTGLEYLGQVSRHMHPPNAPAMAQELAPHAAELEGALAHLRSLTWPDELNFFRERLDASAEGTHSALAGFIAASADSNDVMGLYRSLRRQVGAQEALYPLGQVLAPVSRFFLEPGAREDTALIERLNAAVDRTDEIQVGVLHADNERDSRGGYSLYIPEYYSEDRSWPLVITLHGGSGHGRDSVWSWVREARTRGMLVLSPTSVDRTWSIIEDEDLDIDNLKAMVEFVGQRYRIDPDRILLGGMSDGATYALLAGLYDDVPWTHLAPSSGVMHPMIMMNGSMPRVQDMPIYLMHGALDWMFDVAMAHMTRDTLMAAGARLTYREIADLSHTYPREENPAIADWLLREPPRNAAS